MSQCTTTQDVLVKLEQAVERGDVPYLHALLINQNFRGGGRELRGALVVGHDVEERRQGVQRAGRHHDDVDAVLRGAGRRRAVERRRRQRDFFFVRRLVGGQTESGGDATVAEDRTAVRRLL